MSYPEWSRLMAGDPVSIVAEKPFAGFFKLKFPRDGDFVPVSIFPHEGSLFALRAGKAVPVTEVWPWCAKTPVTYEVYVEATKTGVFPPDKKPARAKAAEPEPTPITSTTADDEVPVDEKLDPAEPEGDAPDDEGEPADDGATDEPAEEPEPDRLHNKPPEALTDFTEQIDDLARRADKLIAKGAAKTQAETDAAADLVTRLGQLEEGAETARKAEKEPFLTAGREVDGKWKPTVDKAAVRKSQLKSQVIGPFLKAESARIAAEKAEAAKAGRAAEAAKAPPAKAGTYGRSVGLTTVVTAMIEDFDATLAFFKDAPRVRDLIQQLATEAVKAKVAVPGAKRHEEKAAR